MQPLDITAAEHSSIPLGSAIPAAQFFSGCDSSSEHSDCENLLQAARIGEAKLHHPRSLVLRKQYSWVVSLVAVASQPLPFLPEAMIKFLSHRHPIWEVFTHPGLRQVYDSDPMLFRKWVKYFDVLLRMDADPLGGPAASAHWWRLLPDSKLVCNWFPGYELLPRLLTSYTNSAMRRLPCGTIAAELNSAMLRMRLISVVSHHVIRFLILPYPVIPALRHCGCHHCPGACTCFPGNNLVLRTVMLMFLPILNNWDLHHPQRRFALTQEQQACLGLVPAGGGCFRPYVHC